MSEKSEAALADLLLGQLLVHDDSLESGGIEEGIDLLRKAAVSMPESAEFQFAVAMAMDGHRDYTDADEPKAAELLTWLQRSFELAPGNLFAVQKLMQRQALFLRSSVAETRVAALKVTETLNAAKTLIAPLNESIKQQRRTDLIATITKALD
ncbi:MAG: hypothetical protein GY758_08325, partial [Fuerstiella sp.]|nr:hypothetical protein [Fuerstiella sp.]